MTQHRHYLSVLIVTEDSAQDACPTLAALAKAAFQLVDPKVRSNFVDFEPLSNSEARAAARANNWRSTSAWDQSRTLQLLRTIATKLLEPGGFVLMHIDGDTKWSERAASTNIRQLEDLLLKKLRLLLEMHLKSRYKLNEVNAAAEAEKSLTRLLVLVPHYSIESWCFQNLAASIEVCQNKHTGAHTALFMEWLSDRSLIDEQVKPKELCCLRSNYNLHLATASFPAAEAFAADTSFAQAVRMLRASSPLVEALAMTHQWPQPAFVC